MSHTDSLDTLGGGFFDRLYDHVAIVRALGLTAKSEVELAKPKALAGDTDSEEAQYTFEEIGNVLRFTITAGYRLVHDLQDVVEAHDLPHHRHFAYDASTGVGEKMPPLYAEQIGLQGDLCPSCQAAEPTMWSEDDDDWRVRADHLILRTWLHGQRAQQYMAFLEQVLIRSDWRDEPAFAGVHSSVAQTKSLLVQHGSCMASPFNTYETYCRPRSRPRTVNELATWVSAPVLDLSSEYVLDRPLCESCDALRTPAPAEHL